MADPRLLPPPSPDPAPGDRPPDSWAPAPGQAWPGAPYGPIPSWPVQPDRRSAGGRPALPIYLALFLVAVIAGSALFVSGFTLGLQSSATPGTSDDRQELFAPFWEAYNNVSTRYVGDVDERTIVEGAIKGMFEALGDPYSAYMTSEEYRNSLQSIAGEFEGIGAEMAAQDADGVSCSPIGGACRLVVIRVLRESPALRAGLLADDVVVAVDGVSTSGKTVEETIGSIRGPKGSEVRLTIDRGGSELELAITRDVIRTEDVRSEVLASGTVGYLRIDGFSSNAAEDFTAQLRSLVVDQGLRRIVLDLRDDPGGFVDAAKRIASQFIAEGPIFWEESADGTKTPQNADPGGVATDPSIQVVVLVNGGSASASEILAGALQDTGRAQLVGETTFGKGTIQEWQLLRNGDSGGFRLSVKKWLTPNQTWIHEQGIEPDVVVETPPGTPADEDPALHRALELLASGGTTGARFLDHASVLAEVGRLHLTEASAQGGAPIAVAA